MLVALSGCPRRPDQPDPATCNIAASEVANERNDEVQTFTHNGIQRCYLVHKPAGWTGTSPLPVMLALHGGGGRPEQMRSATRFNTVADANGFMVVYPAGTGQTVTLNGQVVPVLTWNAGRCCGNAQENQVDDVGYFRELITVELPSHYAIDSRRVYATGISNGAMMTYRLGVELSDLVRAIGPVSGSMMVESGSPARPVPVIHFHGLLDHNAPFDGGIGNILVNPTVQNSIPDTIAEWVQFNNAEPTPVATTTADYTLNEYEAKTGEPSAPVLLYILPNGGHTWPGGVDVTASLGTGPLVESVDASTLIWQFVSRYN